MQERNSNSAVASIERNFKGEQFWERGYAVSTVGLNEEQIRRYIREQEG